MFNERRAQNKKERQQKFYKNDRLGKANDNSIVRDTRAPENHQYRVSKPTRDFPKNGKGRYPKSNIPKHSKERIIRPINVEPVKPLEELRVKNSLWDKVPDDLKGLSAKFAKSSGLFSSPSDNTEKKLTKDEVQFLLEFQDSKQFETYNNNRDHNNNLIGRKLLSLSSSFVSKRVYITELDFQKVSIDILETYFQDIFKRVSILNISQEQLTFSTVLDELNQRYIITCSNSLIATIFVAFNGKFVSEFGTKIMVNRPDDYIQDSSILPINLSSEIKNEINENSNLCCINNIPDNIETAEMKQILSKYGTLKSLVVLSDKITHKSLGIILFEFKLPIPKITKKITECESFNCFHPCINTTNEYYQNLTITMENIKDYLNKNEPSKISKVKPSAIVQLLNCFSISDILNDEKYKKYYDILFSTMSKAPGFIQLNIPRPRSQQEIIDNAATIYGKVYIKFDSEINASECLKNTCGRYFYNRMVLGTYIDYHEYNSIFT